MNTASATGFPTARRWSGWRSPAQRQKPLCGQRSQPMTLRRESSGGRIRPALKRWMVPPRSQTKSWMPMSSSRYPTSCQPLPAAPPMLCGHLAAALQRTRISSCSRTHGRTTACRWIRCEVNSPSDSILPLKVMVPYPLPNRPMAWRTWNPFRSCQELERLAPIGTDLTATATRRGDCPIWWHWLGNSAALAKCRCKTNWLDPF